MNKEINELVDARAKEGKFDLDSVMLKQYLDAKVNRIKRLHEAQKKIQNWLTASKKPV